MVTTATVITATDTGAERRGRPSPPLSLMPMLTQRPIPGTDTTVTTTDPMPTTATVTATATGAERRGKPRLPLPLTLMLRPRLTPGTVLRSLLQTLQLRTLRIPWLLLGIDFLSSFHCPNHGSKFIHIPKMYLLPK